MTYRPQIFTVALVSLVLHCAAAMSSAQNAPVLTIVTEPNAIVWLNDVRFGIADKDGKFQFQELPPQHSVLRVRADGFKEASKVILPTAKGTVNIPLSRTFDPAELAFQEAERLSSEDRDLAVAAYKKAIKLKPSYSSAYVGLARVLYDADDFEQAAKAIKDLRRHVRKGVPEASAIEGRILKDSGADVKAIATFKRAITEGKGFQPEAYTGLGLLYKERAESAASSADYEGEKANYSESARHLKTAVQQLAGAPDAPVIYQLLGLVYENQKEYASAIKVYEEFLAKYPDSSDATAVQSFIVQLKKQMNSQP